MRTTNHFPNLATGVMTHKTEIVSYHGRITARSVKAIQFCIVPADVEYDASKHSEFDVVWFPLSQVKEIHETYSKLKDTMDRIVVSAWIAKEKGLLG